MKPTDLQKEIAKSVSSIINTFANTNDISSPTHLSDIEELLSADLDKVDSKTRRMLVAHVTSIYWLIRNAKLQENDDE